MPEIAGGYNANHATPMCDVISLHAINLGSLFIFLISSSRRHVLQWSLTSYHRLCQNLRFRLWRPATANGCAGGILWVLGRGRGAIQHVIIAQVCAFSGPDSVSRVRPVRTGAAKRVKFQFNGHLCAERCLCAASECDLNIFCIRVCTRTRIRTSGSDCNVCVCSVT